MTIDIDLQGTPYLLPSSASSSLGQVLRNLQSRVENLRSIGTLTTETLELYYKEKRFEQVAESNALEGSTLDVGETELAVMKGVTLTGHDPRFVDDARHLDKALQLLREMAKSEQPSDIQQVKRLHAVILFGHPGAGNFRTQPVVIRGSRHRPPATWADVMAAMEGWQEWSRSRSPLVAPLRAAVLHAWLAHVHPFLNGNGRTARAVGNLELIRAGYPPIIIRRRKDRDRYLDALAESDEGGNLGWFLELLLDRIEDALRDLERAATKGQQYDKVLTESRRKQEGSLQVWNAAVELLASLVEKELIGRVEPSGGDVQVHRYGQGLAVDDYLALCNRTPISRSWSFRIDVRVPGLEPVSRLAWAGYRSPELMAEMPKGAATGPSLLWSAKNPGAFPPWTRLAADAPGGEELTLVGERWKIRRKGRTEDWSTGELAVRIAEEILSAVP